MPTMTATRPVRTVSSPRAMLSALRQLRRDAAHMSTEDVLHALIELRGVDGAVVDLVDGLLLRAEADDVPHAEHRALTDELELIRELAS